MTAFNGTQFNARLSCPSSNAFFELLIGVGTTGDITSTTVTQDLNMDGTVDSAYTLPVTVSGICANGVIACVPGTWNNCQSLAWSADSTGALALSSTTLSNLGGCYCINNHCGNNLVITNLSKVLGDMGGGAASAMAAANPLYAISNVTVDGSSIRYYGQDTSRCGQPGNAALSGYFNSPGSISGDASAAATSNNIYNLLANSPIATTTASATPGAPGMFVTCQLIADATASDQPTCTVNVAVNDACGPYETNARCSLEQEVVDGVTTVQNYNPTGLSPLPSTRMPTNTCAPPQTYNEVYVTHPSGERAATGAVRCDGGVRFVYVSTQDSFYWSTPGGGCENSGYGWVDTTNWVDGTSISSGNNGEQQATFTMVNSTTFRLDRNGLVNVCNDTGTVCTDCSSCSSVSQTINICGGDSGSPLYTATLTVPATCPTNAVPPVTRDWWVKDRRYLCRSDSGYTFDAAWQRIATVKDSATTTGYNDYRLDTATGEWATENSRPLTMPPMPPAQTCMQVCKTRKPRVANDAAGSGVSQDLRTSSTVYDFFYHECGQGNTCPTGTGEEVLKACQCVNDFAEVTSIMQAMRLAGKDLICTGGAVVPLQ